ncbi:hypothetical protein HUJ04_010887 [Dendroctonus ponderosae]|nr:hypothetical protein HUJ04_010887 [Dendroctonus ponderosae]
MSNEQRKRSSVSGSLQTFVYGCHRGRIRQRKGKNTRQFSLKTHNARNLSSDKKLVEIEKELKKINWDIVGLSETETRRGGVGFIINKKIVKDVVQITSVSVRVVYLIIKLNRRYTLKIMVYAPTSTHSEEEMEEFYDVIKDVILFQEVSPKKMDIVEPRRDVSVLNSFSVGSDHRLVTTKVCINIKIERRKILSKPTNTKWTEIRDRDASHTMPKNNKRRTCPEKLSIETKNLMKRRRQTRGEQNINPNKLSELNKTISSAIRKDLRQNNTKEIQAVIETNKSLKVLRKNLLPSPGSKNITMLRNTKSRAAMNKEEILRLLEEFYGELYSRPRHRVITIPYVQNESSEDIPDITTSEINNSLR